MAAPIDPHDGSPLPMPNLVGCKVCGKQVSNSAPTCPHCGQIFPGLHIRRNAEIFGERLTETLNPYAIAGRARAAVRGWSQLSLRKRVCLAAVGIPLCLFMADIALQVCVFSRDWTELREVNEHEAGDVPYTVLYRSEKYNSVSLFSLSPQEWTYQVVAISPSDTTPDKLKALFQELRRDNAGIWSIEITVYDDEAAAREEFPRHRARGGGLDSTPWEYSIWYLDHVDGAGDDRTNLLSDPP